MQAQAQAQAQTPYAKRYERRIDNKAPLLLDEASEDVYGGGPRLWDLLRGFRTPSVIVGLNPGTSLGCPQAIGNESGGNEAICLKASLPRFCVESVGIRL
jgi:hypothetical protein